MATGGFSGVATVAGDTMGPSWAAAFGAATVTGDIMGPSRTAASGTATVTGDTMGPSRTADSGAATTGAEDIRGISWTLASARTSGDCFRGGEGEEGWVERGRSTMEVWDVMKGVGRAVPAHWAKDRPLPMGRDLVSALTPRGCLGTPGHVPGSQSSSSDSPSTSAATATTGGSCISLSTCFATSSCCTTS